MANTSIRPADLPPRASPAASEVTVSDNGSSVAGVTWTDGVNAAVPVANKAKAEAGIDNHDRMTALATKQAIDFQVDPKILAAIGALNLGDASQASVSDFATAAQGLLADSSVQPSISVLSGTGLTGGGTLAANRTISLNSASIASLLLADSAVQPGDLSAVATSGDYDDLANKPSIPPAQVNSDWNASSGVAQILNKPDMSGFATTAQLTAGLLGKFDNPAGTTSQYVRGDGSLATFPAIPTGTVTSVGLSAPTGFTVSGSPVTGSGTLTFAYASGYQGYTTSESSKLSGIQAGAQVNPGVATTSANGLMSSADKTKLNGIAAGATANTGTVTSVAVSVPTGFSIGGSPVTSSGTLAITYASGYQGYTTAEANKLAGIAAGATANQSDAYLLNRANHTGAQAISTVTGLQTALDGKALQSTTIAAGAGLTGGGTLAANRTLALNGASIASLALADTAVQPSDLGDLAYIDFPASPSGNVLNDSGNWVPQGGGGGGGGQVNSVQPGTGISVNSSDPVNPSVSLSAGTQSSLSLTNSALQPSSIGVSVQGYSAVLSATTAAFTTALNSKLNGIEAGAQVNTVTSVASKTGAVTLAKGDVGLGNVDNTSDANKPVSTAQASAINAKVTKAGDTGLGGFTSAGHNLGNLSGTVTPVPTSTSNFKYAGNNAAFTLAAPTTAGYYTIAILVMNAGSGAGAMTATGFGKVHGTFATDANKKHILTIEVFGSDKVLTIRDAS